MQRTRTIAWQDPVESARVALGMSGLDAMRAMSDGTLPPPPIAMTLGFDGVEASEGRATFWLEPDESLYNPIGVVHGGVAATMLDSAMGCAIHTTLEAGVGYGTADLHVRYLRAITATTGRIRAEGVVVHRGSRLATAEGTLVAEATGKVLATGTTSCLVLGSPAAPGGLS